MKKREKIDLITVLPLRGKNLQIQVQRIVRGIYSDLDKLFWNCHLGKGKLEECCDLAGVLSRC
jgi:hypothetical protein